MKALHRHVGQLVVAGFGGYTASAELRALTKEWDLGGVILFGRNIESPEQMAELTFEVQELAQDVPLWVSVDQEGGRVARLRAPFTEWPPMEAVGRSGDTELAERFASALGHELSAVGVTLDFAPVLDLRSETAHPGDHVIGDRALSSDVEEVGRFGRVIISTLQRHGIAACAKHFPGHGDTQVDSHQELPVVEHPSDRLREHEMAPFRIAIAADVATVMTAHVLYPALDDERPATLSPTIVTDILRRELGHQGLIVTDDLDMGAITGSQTVEQAAVRALRAGCDTVLMCSESIDRHAAVLEAVIHAVEEGELDSRVIEDAWVRQQRVKATFMGGEPRRRPLSGQALRARLGTAQHKAVAEEIARA
ncbi:MAG: beta-N-acetylhexosaminidase [Vicinamibacterales bacterium]|nr:beta-N-acetylhexosaminidase [Vicinamibacterales bacterium]HJN46411.1 beta-N-acetylhexosaminidase [Vicinamibacterales bacterium]